MRNISFSYEQTAQIDEEIVERHWQELMPVVERLAAVTHACQDTACHILRLPFDDNMHAQIKRVAMQKRQLSPVMLVLIGMGGSSLAMRVLYGVLPKKGVMEICFIDTCDSDYVSHAYDRVEDVLKEGSQVIINVVSKSGHTLETAANADIFITLVKKYRADTYRQYVVVTTDKDSPLWQWASAESIMALEIPCAVGGRYSALSPVALFPLALIGASIDEFCAGARCGVACATASSLCENMSATRAIIMYANFLQSHLIHDLFLFSVDLHEMGMWYRQLVAESLGKDEKGILPTVSIGSADMHSMVQLYLGGGIKRFTTFIGVEKNSKDVYLPSERILMSQDYMRRDRSLARLHTILFASISRAYMKQKEPFCTIMLPQKSLFYIGQLMQIMMIEVIYLGFLLKVNPFDQPHVELYKQEAKKLLKEHAA